MTWRELGEGLEAIALERDLPYRVAQTLIDLNYAIPGKASNGFRPSLTPRGATWLREVTLPTSTLRV